LSSLQETLDRALAATLYQHRIDSLKPAVRALEDASRRMFVAQAYDCLLAVYGADLSEATKEEDDERKAAAILLAIAAALALRLSRDVATLTPGLEQSLAIAVANAGLAKHGIHADLRSVKAQEWLAAHGAELVTGINQFTREQMAIVLRNGFAAGKSIDDIAADLMWKFHDMSYARAYRIAVTEANKAWTYAELEHAKLMEESGYKMVKQWLLGPMHPRMDRCDEAAEMGSVPLSHIYPNGIGGPPDHPHCGCCLTSYPDTGQSQPWGSLVLGLTPTPFGQGDANAA
jgi:hypothetical protein